MDQRQVTSLLFCILLGSTIAHEYLHHKLVHEGKSLHGDDHHHLRSNHHHEDLKAHHARSSALLHHHNGRSNHQQFRVDDDCSWVCDDDGDSGNIKIIIRASINVIALLNVTSNHAIVFDLNNGLVALFNGNTGISIIINIETGIGYYITSKTSGGVWIASKESFEVFINGLASLKVIWDIGVKVGVKIDVKATIRQEILKEIVVIIEALGVEIVGSLSVVIKVLLNISKTILVTYKDVIVFLISGAGNLVTHISGDLQWLISVIGGIVKIIGKIPGGLAALIKAKVVLDLKILLTASNAIKLFVALIVQISAKIDISVVLKDIISSPKVLLELLIELAGNVGSGVNGVIIVVLRIILTLRKESSDLLGLVTALIRLAVSLIGNDVDIGAELKSSVEALIQLLQKVTSSVGKAVLDILIAIRDDKLVIAGINVSAIIKIILGGVVQGALTLVVTILLQLRAVIGLVDIVGNLLLGLLGLIRSVVGIRILVVIVPTIQIKSSAISGGIVDIKALILGNISIISILKGGFNLINILKSLPIIGNIYVALSASLKIESKGSISLDKILESGGAIINAIASWIKGILGIGGDGSGDGSGSGGWGGGISIGGGGSGIGIGIGIGNRHDGHHNGHHHQQDKRHH